MTNNYVIAIALAPVWVLVMVCLLKIRQVFALMHIEMSARAERAQIEKGAPRVTVGDDGAVSVTWFGRDRRVSLCFENEPSESSWHVVAKREVGGECHAEKLTQMNVTRFRRALASIQ